MPKYMLGTNVCNYLMKHQPQQIRARFAKDYADISAYLSVVIEEGDAGELANALGVAARARGIAQIAEETGIGREVLHKALRADAQPRFDTISRVCKALGVKLVVQPTGA